MCQVQGRQIQNAESENQSKIQTNNKPHNKEQAKAKTRKGPGQKQAGIILERICVMTQKAQGKETIWWGRFGDGVLL